MTIKHIFREKKTWQSFVVLLHLLWFGIRSDNTAISFCLKYFAYDFLLLAFRIKHSPLSAHPDARSIGGESENVNRHTKYSKTCEDIHPCKWATCHSWQHYSGTVTCLWYFAWSLFHNLDTSISWIVVIVSNLVLYFTYVDLHELSRTKGCVVFEPWAAILIH